MLFRSDITLEGQDPVLPGAAKITFIVPRGVLKKHLPKVLSPLGLIDHWNDARVASTSLLGLTSPNSPINSYNPLLCVHDTDDNGNKGSGCIS